MARAGWYIRQSRALAAASDRLCSCGHRMGDHRELQPTLELRDGAIVTVPHPDYVPCHFHCIAPGCGCIRKEA